MTKKNDADTCEYDASGNMSKRNEVVINYDYNNRPTSIGSTTFVYDFSGQRVKKNSTIYIGKLYECTGGNCTKYIFAGSNRIAYKVGSAVYYYHTDHLGSSSIITNTSGNKVNELYYYPYGKTRYALDSSLTHQFTGQELDDETELYYYGARYYDPAIGRFISADSIVPDFSDPQTLNRYSYCRNNPIIFTDPNGHVAWFVPILIGAAVGGVTSAIMGQDIGIGMLTGAITGAIFGGIGGAIKEAAVESITAKVALHAYAGAFAGGFNTAFTGGDVGINALTGGISGGLGMAAGHYLPNEFGYQLAGRTAVGGISGGLAAEMYGGDFGQGFARGAETAAIGFLCNEAAHKKDGIIGRMIERIKGFFISNEKAAYAGLEGNFILGGGVEVYMCVDEGKLIAQAYIKACLGAGFNAGPGAGSVSNVSPNCKDAFKGFTLEGGGGPVEVSWTPQTMYSIGVTTPGPQGKFTPCWYFPIRPWNLE